MTCPAGRNGASVALTPKSSDLAREWELIGADYDLHRRIIRIERLMFRPRRVGIELSEGRGTVQRAGTISARLGKMERK